MPWFLMSGRSLLDHRRQTSHAMILPESDHPYEGWPDRDTIGRPGTILAPEAGQPGESVLASTLAILVVAWSPLQTERLGRSNTRAGQKWVHTAELLPGGGDSSVPDRTLAISGDGHTAIAGARTATVDGQYEACATHVFRLVNGHWTKGRQRTTALSIQSSMLGNSPNHSRNRDSISPYPLVGRKLMMQPAWLCPDSAHSRRMEPKS